MKWSPDQRRVAARFIDYCTQSRQRGLSLVGPAGSGKSTVLKWLIEIAAREHFPLLLTAMTHKACANLEAISGREVQTLHKFLGARVVQDEDSDRQHAVIRARELTADAGVGLTVVVDEASMANGYMIKGCAARSDVRFLFVGDMAQLTPVGEPVSLVVDPARAPWQVLQLTSIHRQTAGNPIIAYATAVRECAAGVLPAPVNSVNDAGGIIVLDENSWRAQLVEAAEQASREGHVDDVRCVSYTNAFADEANRQIRKRLYGRAAKSEPYLPGETLQLAEQYKALDEHGEEVDLQTGTELVVAGVQSGVDETVYEVGFKPLVLKTHAITTTCGLSLCCLSDYNERKRVLSRARVEAAQSTMTRGTFRKFWRISNLLADLRAPFASTCHRAQGSPYRDVYIDLHDFQRCRSVDERRRLYYTAVTRASRFVYFTGV